MLHGVVVELGYSQRNTDAVSTRSPTATLIGVYVDDLLVTDMDVKRADKLFIGTNFLELKDLSIVSYFLGFG